VSLLRTQAAGETHKTLASHPLPLTDHSHPSKEEAAAAVEEEHATSSAEDTNSEVVVNSVVIRPPGQGNSTPEIKMLISALIVYQHALSPLYKVATNALIPLKNLKIAVDAL
jgi:hypothetical protein